MTNQPIIAFNTGRHYTTHGQRIAATRLASGRVLFVDYDRDLDYVTVEPVPLTRQAVMSCYDANDTESSYSAIPDYAERTRLIETLERVAAAL